MKKVLVIGDTIIDEYVFGRATRLCPEGPVPVIVPERTETRSGGARLVANQLEILIGEENVGFLSGSHSKKKRIFADDRLICRLDEDSYAVDKGFADFVIPQISSYDLLIISDYGKGALTQESAKQILNAANIPVLVDAKNNFHWYYGAFALFPNEFEESGIPTCTCHVSGGGSAECRAHFDTTVVRKLGARGCSINGHIQPLEQEHSVRDVTGAGDIFLAAFAAKMAAGETDLYFCARFGNMVAARSVEFVGTHVVTDITLEES